MNLNQTIGLSAIAIGIVTSLSVARVDSQAPPTPDQMVAALKQNLAESQKRLRQYEWIETTAISLKGEEKSRKQQRVYYGADGNADEAADRRAAAAGEAGARPEAAGAGLSSRHIVENKKDEMKEYMEKAAALIHQYVPPTPRRFRRPRTRATWR